MNSRSVPPVCTTRILFAVRLQSMIGCRDDCTYICVSHVPMHVSTTVEMCHLHYNYVHVNYMYSMSYDKRVAAASAQ